MAQLQNIPSRSKPNEYDGRIQKLGPRIRKMFEPRPPDRFSPEGYDLIVVDLSQLELRLGAYFTRDPRLLKVYREFEVADGQTFYTGDPHDETAVTMDVPRKLAKNLNFGLMYGMSAKAFARYAKLYLKGTHEYDVNSAIRYVTKFRATYSGVFQFHNKLSSAWSEGQRAYTLISGRKRHFPRLARVSPGTVYNSKIQGSAADIMKVHLWAIEKFLLQDPAFAGLIPIIQVHDEFVFECPKRITKKSAVAIKFIMEYPWFDTTVPLLASAKVCGDWSQSGDDDVPEVGRFYARVKDDLGKEVDLVFRPEDWPRFLRYDDQKRVIKKSAVALLTDKQATWARSLLPQDLPKFGKKVRGMRILSDAEWKERKNRNDD